MNKSFSIFLLLFLLACEKPTEVDMPAHEAKLVVNGQVHQGSYFAVQVGRSIGITQTFDDNNPDPYSVPDAVVILKQNGTVADTLRYNPDRRSYWGQRHLAQAGSQYSLQVSAPGFGSVETASRFPELVRPAAVALRRKARQSGSSEPMDEIQITLNDVAGVSNFYLLRIKDAYEQTVYCVQTPDKDVERLVYSDPFVSPSDECLSGNRLLVGDKNFDGKTKKLVFYTYHSSMEPREGQQGTMQWPTIELLHINEDYYRYLKSFNAFENADGNPFAEPVNVVSNVTNGYGFFTTYAMAVDTLR